MNYRQVIEFTGRSLDDIFRLPCVKSAEKGLILTNGEVRPTVMLLVLTAERPHGTAIPGQLLCEDYDGGWHVRTREQLKAEQEQWQEPTSPSTTSGRPTP
jgi:hypothetical protein